LLYFALLCFAFLLFSFLFNSNLQMLVSFRNSFQVLIVGSVTW
jgi:hypothetical protein